MKTRKCIKKQLLCIKCITGEHLRSERWPCLVVWLSEKINSNSEDIIVDGID